MGLALTSVGAPRQLKEMPITEPAVHELDTAPEQGAPAKGPRDRGLLLIGLFKLLKSAFFFLLGVGALHLLHKDLGDEAMHAATSLRLDPEGRLVSLLMEKVDLIDSHHLRQIGVATFAYSALSLVEGVGLTLQKTWAEYLTLCVTGIFLPWEIFELIRELTPFRIGLLAINIAVLVYLVWLQQRKKRYSRSS